MRSNIVGSLAYNPANCGHILTPNYNDMRYVARLNVGGGRSWISRRKKEGAVIFRLASVQAACVHQ